MASATDIQRLRRLAAATDTTQYPAEDLAARIDDAGTVELAARDIWREKAAAAADLVDTTEGSSSRKMSQIRDQASKMAALYDPVAEVVPVDVGSRPRTRPIVRP